MRFHIVGNGESVDDILRGYDITIDELKNENKHIRIWNYLIPGTKLKIPVLTESIIEDLNEIEPFIEDYYPKIKVEEEQYQIIEELEDSMEEDNITEFDENTFESEEMDYDNNDNSKNNEEIDEKTDSEIENILEDCKDNTNMRNNNPVSYRYVYPQPYYYRPIVYIIPRK